MPQHKGAIPWNEGKKWSDEVRAQISISCIGQKRGPHSEEHKRKIGDTQRGKPRPYASVRMLLDKNPMWKGDNVDKISGLHAWLRRNLPKPELCEMCNLAPPYDVANITGKYERGFENWKYLCRRCHMLSDGRMSNLI